jgi:hypothetical protein
VQLLTELNDCKLWIDSQCGEFNLREPIVDRPGELTLLRLSDFLDFCEHALLNAEVSFLDLIGLANEEFCNILGTPVTIRDGNALGGPFSIGRLTVSIGSSKH